MLTKDTLFGGELVCFQHKSGYRFSVDSVLAAHFCRIHPGEKILDLGAGSGVIGLIIAFRFDGIFVTGLEIQADLVRLAEKNIAENNLHGKYAILQGDCCRINQLVQPESFHIVVSNPPYRKTGSGRVNAKKECARARHELDAKLDDFIRAASFAVKNRGIAVFVYPASRTAILLASLIEHRLIPKRLQPVYSYPEDEKAILVLVEAVKNGGEELSIQPPLFIYSKQNGPYSQIMENFYKPASDFSVNI